VPLGERPAARLDKQLGYKCYACSSYLRDPQLNRSRMAAHLYGSCKATYEVRVAAWNSKPLNENKPHPMGCPLIFGSPSSPSNTGSFTPSLPPPESIPCQRTAPREQRSRPLLQVGRREVSLCIFMLPARKGGRTAGVLGCQVSRSYPAWGPTHIANLVFEDVLKVP
jgi:hypothetical protein